MGMDCAKYANGEPLRSFRSSRGKGHYNEGSLMESSRAAALRGFRPGHALPCSSAPLICCLLVLASCSKAPPAGVAATVNGRPIYFSEIDTTYKSQFPAQGE